MPGQTTRKVMKHGSSGVIAIPSDYCRYHKLQHGDEVLVLYDHLILIIPKAEQSSISAKKSKLIDQLLR